MTKQYASFGTRMACHLGDIMIIQFIIFPFWLLFYLSDIHLQNFELFSLFIWGVYSTIMNASSQRGTIAKRMMGVKIEKENGYKLNMIQSAVRFIFGFILFGVIIGILPIFFNRKHQGLHDILIGSVVRYRKF